MLSNTATVRISVIDERDKIMERLAKQRYEQKVDRIKDIRNLNKLKQLDGLLLWFGTVSHGRSLIDE